MRIVRVVETAAPARLRRQIEQIPDGFLHEPPRRPTNQQERPTEESYHRVGERVLAGNHVGDVEGHDASELLF